MPLAAGALRSALAEVDLPAEGDVIQRGKPLAARLCGFIEAHCAGSEIVEVYHWAFNVEFVLRKGDHFAIECLSPDAFRMYPGFVRGDTVVWANIWVRGSDLTLDELVEQVNDVAFRSTKEEFLNA
jgi:hypothetical protein